jgi:uncharacterized protein YecE (DUF72 family)
MEKILPRYRYDVKVSGHHPGVAIRGYYLGCPGWGIKSWVGRLFPPGTKHTDFLARYAEVFNTVEGNTTFYALPTADIVARWRDQVPATFRFCFKFPRTITHDKLLVDARPEIDEFLARIAPLGETIGTLFLQLPPRFGIAQLPHLAELLAVLPREHHYGVEVRDEALYASDELIALLAERGVDLVNMDSRGIHASKSLQFAEVRGRKPAMPVVPRATASHPMVRFVPHEVFDESREHAEPWSRQLAAWITAGKQPYFFMHAPDDTHAPENAYVFHAMLRAHLDVGDLPPWPGAPRQLGLF